MTFRIEALNVLVFALALVVAWVVYRRTKSVESAVVSGAAAVAMVIILFTPIDNGTEIAETTTTPVPSSSVSPPALPQSSGPSPARPD
ncbi:hypothetical protein [Streptomyces sp. NPDC056549]|uniref:hypothetical protein n=1 Tax=Streptomyces sp. NPDC056549 TaxID=3345864 RepID=UPI0036C943FE